MTELPLIRTELHRNWFCCPERLSIREGVAASPNPDDAGRFAGFAANPGRFGIHAEVINIKITDAFPGDSLDIFDSFWRRTSQKRELSCGSPIFGFGVRVDPKCLATTRTSALQRSRPSWNGIRVNNINRLLSPWSNSVGARFGELEARAAGKDRVRSFLLARPRSAEYKDVDSGLRIFPEPLYFRFPARS